MLLIVGSSWSINMSALGSPVPITLQSLIVLVIGVLAGPNIATLATLSYLLTGIMGLEVFAQGGSGFSVITGASGGYLLGFVPAVYWAGMWTNPKEKCSNKDLLLALFVGTLIILGVGFIHLAKILGPMQAWQKGISPFLPGAFIKGGIAYFILSPYIRWRIAQARG